MPNENILFNLKKTL